MEPRETESGPSGRPQRDIHTCGTVVYIRDQTQMDFGVADRLWL